MRYFRINVLGDSKDRSLAFIDEPPVGLGIYDYRMSRGKRIGEHYPSDARIYLQPKSPGIKLGSLIGNTLNYLIVNSQIKDIIAEDYRGELELLPFTLYNHKKRVHSNDYWIINPIGSLDCLNKAASETTYSADVKTDVVAVHKYVFDPKKLEGAPDLFRIPEDLTQYFISGRLAKVLQDHKFTNIFLFEVGV
jgi:hypothetical protein